MKIKNITFKNITNKSMNILEKNLAFYKQKIQNIKKKSHI